LEVGELVYSEILTKLSPLNISILMAALTYEPRRGDEFEEKYPVDAIVNELEKNEFLSKHIKPQILMRVASITHAWFEGASFDQVLVMSNMSEGDIIRFFRQVIDLLRQIRGSLLSMDPRHALIPKLAESLRRIDRDLVSVEL
jgi:superfamily II RNA helicase